ncbi:MAG TPA: GNAT family N-acetyltransferase, partial [Chitinophaga sp.]
CFIEYAGRSILAAQSADTMTHPGHRYKGMFAELSRLTFALCREAGLRLVFGFPNQHSYPGAIRMGWKETGTMSLFVVRISALPLASLSIRWPFMKGWYQRYQHNVIARYASPLPGVHNTVLTGDAAGVQRSGPYLAYKKYNATQVLQIGEAKIWIKMGPMLLIGDMEQVDENNFDNVMHTLKGICHRLGIRQLAFHISQDTDLHRLWSARYKAIPSYPVLFQDFGAELPLEKIKFTFADIDIF